MINEVLDIVMPLVVCIGVLILARNDCRKQHAMMDEIDRMYRENSRLKSDIKKMNLVVHLFDEKVTDSHRA